MTETSLETIDDQINERTTIIGRAVGVIATPVELVRNIRNKFSDLGNQVLTAIGEERQ